MAGIIEQVRVKQIDFIVLSFRIKLQPSENWSNLDIRVCVPNIMVQRSI